MFRRKLIEKLLLWKTDKNRKPLIIRGARQVGKTTLVKQFSKEFDHFISLNLEKSADLALFSEDQDVETLCKILFLQKKISPKTENTTLLFVDEIQYSEVAIKLLRYFYEEKPEIHVIAAGSLLETILDNKASFPVGRVSYLLLRPFSFAEFVEASGHIQALKALYTFPFEPFAHEILLDLFKEYTLTGGMPEVVSNYLNEKDINKTATVYEDLITTYIDDVEKYAKSDAQTHIIRHVIKNAILTAGQRIKFEGFGKSNYKSKEIGEAFRLLEKTFLINLTYPTTSVKAPIQADIKKSPKPAILDTGIMSYFTGQQIEILKNRNIDDIYEGRIAEHIVGQELLSLHDKPLFQNHFWVREKKQSSAEVDFIISHNNLLIPVEVKLGSTGRLRSLMEFIDLAPHNYAVRIYSGKLSFQEEKTISGKAFHLLNLPFYLTGQIDQYVELLGKSRWVSG